MKKCSGCKKPKANTEFRRRRSTPTIILYGVCRECENKASVEWGKRHPEARNQACRNYSRKHRAYMLIRYARERAIEKGFAFDLDRHRAEIQARLDLGICELTGIPLRLDGCRSFNSPSLDRKDSTRGYTYDNIRVVCFLMNSALGNWGEDVLHAVVSAWLRKRTGEGVGGQDAPLHEGQNCEPEIRVV